MTKNKCGFAKKTTILERFVIVWIIVCGAVGVTVTGLMIWLLILAIQWFMNQ